MSTLVSIFDITLIIDSICHSLSFHEIQICRLVNKHWSSILKPHLWSHPKLPATTTLTDDKITALNDHKPWIRSLTIAAPHIEKISTLNFTHLQELILYDQNFESTHEDDPAPLAAIISLIDNNTDLWSIEIDLNRYHYRGHQRSELSSALMLAIARHPSLTRLVWHVPFGHADQEFAQYLLYVCQQRPIQELYVLRKQYVNSYCYICDGDCSLADFDCDQFIYGYIGHLERIPEWRVLRQKLEEVSVEQWLSKSSFAFRKLSLPLEFHQCILPLLRNCPYLQEVSVELEIEQGEEVIKILTRCATLWGLDLRTGWYEMDCAREIQRFAQLRFVHFPEMPKEMLQSAVESLRGSSVETLEVLGLNISVSAEDVISVLQSFPNLKAIDLTIVRIYIQDNYTFPSDCYVPGDDARTVDECIVRNWDSSQLHRPDETMSEWWDHWTKGKKFMHEISSAYVQQRTESILRPMFMRFMYPIKAFMSKAESFAYAEGTGMWINSAGRNLTVADAKLMADAQYALAERRAKRRDDRTAEWLAVQQGRRYDTDSVWEELRGYRFNEYDETEVDEPAREYVIAKSRNRHHSLRAKKVSLFRRPFKK